MGDIQLLWAYIKLCVHHKWIKVHLCSISILAKALFYSDIVSYLCFVVVLPLKNKYFMFNVKTSNWIYNQILNKFSCFTRINFHSFNVTLWIEWKKSNYWIFYLKHLTAQIQLASFNSWWNFSASGTNMLTAMALLSLKVLGNLEWKNDLN